MTALTTSYKTGFIHYSDNNGQLRCWATHTALAAAERKRHYATDREPKRLIRRVEAAICFAAARNSLWDTCVDQDPIAKLYFVRFRGSYVSNSFTTVSQVAVTRLHNLTYLN